MNTLSSAAETAPDPVCAAGLCCAGPAGAVRQEAAGEPSRKQARRGLAVGNAHPPFPFQLKRDLRPRVQERLGGRVGGRHRCAGGT